MTKILTKEQLKEIVREVLYEQDAASPNALFGKYLFGPGQKNPAAQLEPNTPEEDVLFKRLSAHYGGMGHVQSANLGKELLGVVKPELQKGNYTNLLAPPAGAVVYRGMNLTPGQFAKIVRMDKQDIHADPNKGWYVGSAGVIIPTASKKYGTMSWTTDPKVATDFAGVRNIKGGVYAVFTAQTNTKGNNFFVNPDETSKAFKTNSGGLWIPFKEFEDEKEVISVGPVRFTDVAFYYAIPQAETEEAQQRKKRAEMVLTTFWRKELAPLVLAADKKLTDRNAAKKHRELFAHNQMAFVDMVFIDAQKQFDNSLKKKFEEADMDPKKTGMIISSLINSYVSKRINGNSQQEAFTRNITSAKYAVETWNLLKPQPPKKVQDPTQALLYALGIRAKAPAQVPGSKY